MSEALQIAIVVGAGASAMSYLLGLMQGSLAESRKKLNQEVSATYYPYVDSHGKIPGYVKVYKSRILLGDENDR